MLPDFTLHPDTYTASPLTSPHKTLHNTIMFAEHMLHAPVSRIETPSSVRVPYPLFLSGYNSNPLSSQFHDCRPNVDSMIVSSGDDNVIVQNSEISLDDQLTSESIESSTDSFSDGTVSSTNKRKKAFTVFFFFNFITI